MKVVGSDEAVYALIALEMKLAERYSAEKAAEVVDNIVRRSNVSRTMRSSGVRCRNTVIHSFASSLITGIACFIGRGRMRSKSSRSSRRIPLDDGDPEND